MRLPSCGHTIDNITVTPISMDTFDFHEGASISFTSGRPAVKPEMLARVVSRMVPRASRVKNA